MAKIPNLGICGLEEGAEVTDGTKKNLFNDRLITPNSSNLEINENTNAGAI